MIVIAAIVVVFLMGVFNWNQNGPAAIELYINGNGEMLAYSADRLDPEIWTTGFVVDDEFEYLLETEDFMDEPTNIKVHTLRYGRGDD